MEEELLRVGSADCCLVSIVKYTASDEVLLLSVISPSCTAVHWWCMIVSPHPSYILSRVKGVTMSVSFMAISPQKSQLVCSFLTHYVLKSKQNVFERTDEQARYCHLEKVGLLHIETGVCGIEGDDRPLFTQRRGATFQRTAQDGVYISLFRQKSCWLPSRPWSINNPFCLFSPSSSLMFSLAAKNTVFKSPGLRFQPN